MSRPLRPLARPAILLLSKSRYKIGLELSGEEFHHFKLGQHKQTADFGHSVQPNVRF